MKTLAIIVNYKAAELATRAARSVIESETLGPLRLVLVDNSCDPDQTEQLRSAVPDSVDLLQPAANLGFGNACNLAAASHASDLILLLNPDAQLLPGCLLRLQTALQNDPGAGAVSPQLFWDDDLQFLLPPPYPVALFLIDLLRFRGSAGYVATPALDRLWRRYSLRIWTAASTIRVRNLSGAAVLIRRNALQSNNRIFDPGFFLYFEDSDLFLRMRRARRHLLLDPKAHAIHYYDQCARDQWIEKRGHLLQARDLFLTKHYPALARWHMKRPQTAIPAAITQHLPNRYPKFFEPFSITIPKPPREAWLFEWSPHPDFIPAVGCFGTGRKLSFSRRHWDQLAPGTYYGRIGAPSGRRARHLLRFAWEVRAVPMCS